MEIKVTLKPRTGNVSAEAIYYGDKITVLAGGRINLDFANHIRGGKTAKKYRDDSNCVDKTGKIIKDCEFTSPSTAAQFVLGSSTNGYEAWKVEPKKSLGTYLKENNLR